MPSCDGSVVPSLWNGNPSCQQVKLVEVQQEIIGRPEYLGHEVFFGNHNHVVVALRLRPEARKQPRACPLCDIAVDHFDDHEFAVAVLVVQNNIGHEQTWCLRRTVPHGKHLACMSVRNAVSHQPLAYPGLHLGANEMASR